MMEESIFETTREKLNEMYRGIKNYSQPFIRIFQDIKTITTCKYYKSKIIQKNLATKEQYTQHTYLSKTKVK